MCKKNVGILALLFLSQCKTVRKVSLPAIPSRLDFSGYTAQGTTTYCEQSTTPDTCTFTPEQEKFAQDCKEARHCTIEKGCQLAGWMLITCKDCSYLCSGNPSATNNQENN